MFNNNKQLLKRIEGIESELGLVWSVNADGFGSHDTTERSWSLAGRVKKIEDAQPKKASGTLPE